MFKWIRNNTPTDAVFLIAPIIPSLYVLPERAVFISYKHGSHSTKDIMEWYKESDWQTIMGNYTKED